ncbi:MAG: PQQ-binding-like beta-propeller repeat protein [Anaerolineae bacterium]|nr:PQQ-binding-like beta-propeller repeat protein [Anaerolineae bacterium]
MTFWNQREQNPQRIAFVNAQLQFPLEPLWMSDLGSTVSLLSPPIVVEGIVFICSTRQLYAFNLKTGDSLWAFNPQAELAMKGTPAFCQDRIFFSDSIGVRYSLDAYTGQLRWRDHKPRTTNEAFCVYDNKLFTTFTWRENDNNEQGCMALGLDGKILWQFHTPNLVPMKGVAAKDNHLVFGDRSGQIWALDIENGKEIWSVRINEIFDLQPYQTSKERIRLLSLPVIIEDILLAQVHRAMFVALNLENGNLLWHRQTGLLPGFSEQALIFLEQNRNQLCHIDILTGEIHKATEPSVPRLVHAEAKRALVVGNTYIVGTNQPQGLFAYDIGSGQLLWRFETELESSGFSSAPAFSDNKLVIGSDAGKIYCFG